MLSNDRYETILSREKTLTHAVVGVLTALFLISAILLLAAW